MMITALQRAVHEEFAFYPGYFAQFQERKERIVLDFASYETPATSHHQLGLLCTAYGRFARKTATCPPRRLECYAVVWVSSGCGWLETEATSHRLQVVGGSLFWLFPQVMHTYAPNAGGWTEQWALFEGPLTKTFEHLGFLSTSRSLQYIETPAAIENIFAQLHTDFVRGGPLTVVLSGALVYRLVIVAHQLAVESQAERDPVVREVEHSRRWLDEHAFEFCDLEELAATCHMGYSTFRRHFKTIIGCSPKEYILRVRLRRAKELLAFTQQSIAEVAKSAGFTDPYYFSRLFQDKEGIAPTLFRAQQRLPPNDG
jgi:AraC-like DNA-binding protein